MKLKGDIKNFYAQAFTFLVLLTRDFFAVIILSTDGRSSGDVDDDDGALEDS